MFVVFLVRRSCYSSHNANPVRAALFWAWCEGDPINFR